MRVEPLVVPTRVVCGGGVLLPRVARVVLQVRGASSHTIRGFLSLIVAVLTGRKPQAVGTRCWEGETQTIDTLVRVRLGGGQGWQLPPHGPAGRGEPCHHLIQ